MVSQIFWNRKIDFEILGAERKSDVGLMSIRFPDTVFLRLQDKVFILPKQSQNLDSSDKMDLDLWEC